MKKIITLTVAIIIAVLLTAWYFKPSIERLSLVGTLFSGAEQYENFSRIAQIMPTSTMSAAPTARPFPVGTNMGALPDAFSYAGDTIDVNQFLQKTDTSALLVIQRGEIVFEQYWLTGGQSVNWLSMSVAKSFIATAIGIAVDEGKIDIARAITDYEPALKGSAYDGVRIKDILQMSSGAAWNEDYGDPDSDINRMGKSMAFGTPLGEFVGNIEREFEPGTINRYNSADTQALGMLLSAATGTSVTAYMQEKIWHPLGMEADAYWIIDDEGVELAFAGLNATARDYAKLGELYRLKGMWHGKRIVSESWVTHSTTPDAPYLMPNVNEDFPLGYGYQWWVIDSTEGEYSAIGVYNQFIYVNPTRDLIIVKLSASSDYGATEDQSTYRELETIEMFREIGRLATLQAPTTPSASPH